jgi:hypothetical protein
VVPGLEKLAEVTKSIRQGTFDPNRARMLFKDYAATWLQSRRGEITQSTFDSYEYAHRVHVIPTFGDTEIGKITRAQVRLFTARKAEQKKANGLFLSKDSVRIFRAALHAVLGREKKFKNIKNCNFGLNEIRYLQLLIFAKRDFFSRPSSQQWRTALFRAT